jgi:hypothetical protein
MAGSGSNTLRAVLKELGWSRKRLVAELRRQAAIAGESLPGTESLIAMVSRWVNNHQQPSDFYRDLLARTLGRPRAELFSDEAARLELAAEAEPWLLARALEASSVGLAALEALEEAVGEFARSYPSTAPTVLARPVLEHFRDVTRLLDGPLPVARFFDRPRLAGFRGTSHLLLGQPKAAQAALADVLALRDPADVKGRSLARLDLAQAYVQDRAIEEACAAVGDALAIRHENRVGPILRRAREVRASLEPWREEQPVRNLDEQLRPLLSA